MSERTLQADLQLLSLRTKSVHNFMRRHGVAIKKLRKSPKTNMKHIAISTVDASDEINYLRGQLKVAKRKLARATLAEANRKGVEINSSSEDLLHELFTAVSLPEEFSYCYFTDPFRFGCFSNRDVHTEERDYDG